MIQLGSKVRDIYSGFEGTAVRRLDYMYGSAQIEIESTEAEERGEAYWFPEQRVEVLEDTGPRYGSHSQPMATQPMATQPTEL